MRQKYWVITGILFLALLLRFLGIWHGYPYSFYPDEAHFVKRALSFGSFDFNPHWFRKPAFYMYILFFEYGLYFLIGKIIGLWSLVSEFAVSYIRNPGPFYLIGRFSTVLFGLGSIWIVYRLGEQHFKKNVGIVAALLLSLSYGHIVSSQDIKADIPAMFFAILSMLFLLNYFKNIRLRDLLLASVFAGMGTATKKYPIIMLIPIVICIILINKDVARKRKIVSLIGIVFLMFWATYFVCSPYSFIDSFGFKSTFSFVFSSVEKIYHIFDGEKIVKHYDFIARSMGISEGFIDYFRVLLSTEGMGIPISGIAIIGFINIFLKFNKKIFLFILYPVIFVAVSVLEYPGYAEARHQLPLYPFLAILGAAFIVELAGNKNLRGKMVYVIMLICLLYPFYKIVERGLYVSKEDTRNIAKAWIETNIPAGTKILIDENGPQLFMNEENIQRMLKKAEKADTKGQFTAHYATYLKYQLLVAKDSITYDLREIRFPWWREKELTEGIHDLFSDYDKDAGNPLKSVGVESYKYYIKNRFEYAVVSSNRYKMFINDTQIARNYPSYARFYHELFSRSTLIKEFSPFKEQKPGPIVKVFRFTY